MTRGDTCGAIWDGEGCADAGEGVRRVLKMRVKRKEQNIRE